MDSLAGPTLVPGEEIIRVDDDDAIIKVDADEAQIVASVPVNMEARAAAVSTTEARAAAVSTTEARVEAVSTIETGLQGELDRHSDAGYSHAEHSADTKMEAADAMEGVRIATEAAGSTAEAASSAEAVEPSDDPWAGWTGCICGGGYHGEMVGCDGGCEDWFHFGCVGLKRQPRGEWVCSACSTKAAKRSLTEAKRAASSKRQKGVDLEPVQLTSRAERGKPEKKMTKVEESLASKTERRGRADLEALVSRARPLKFDPVSGALLEAGEGGPSRPCAGAARLAPVPHEVFVPLRRLHENIVAALRRGKMLQSWEGKGREQNLRSRGFAFLPERYGKFGKEHMLERGLTFHAAEKQGAEAEADEAANWKSCMTLR
jgi:hypothetical protein